MPSNQRICGFQKLKFRMLKAVNLILKSIRITHVLFTLIKLNTR